MNACKQGGIFEMGESIDQKGLFRDLAPSTLSRKHHILFTRT